MFYLQHVQGHRGIVTVVDAFVTPWMVTVVMEECHGCLRSSLRSSTKLLLEGLTELAGDLSDGLAHVHSRGILHRDISSKNVLLRRSNLSDRRVHVIADFGMACTIPSPHGLSNEYHLCQAVCAITTRAPEVLFGGKHRWHEGQWRPGALCVYGAPADVYSLGAVILEASLGRPWCWKPDQTEKEFAGALALRLGAMPTHLSRRLCLKTLPDQCTHGPWVPWQATGALARGGTLARALRKVVTWDPKTRPSASELCLTCLDM